jgi:Na+/proline symporter
VLLPHGVLGLVVASLAAAYMSTISTHLNWGASYIVDDCYRRFVARDRDERHYVAVGRAATLVLILLSSIVSLWLENAFQAFQILLQIGAGTGLIFLLRWFWWRINAWSEISAMIISFVVALYFQFVHPALGFAPLSSSVKLLAGVAVTTVGWLTVTMLTRPTERPALQRFYDRIRPPGGSWARVVDTGGRAPEGGLAPAFLCWFLGCLFVYAALFGTGYLLYGKGLVSVLCFTTAAVAGSGLFRALPRVHFE